MGDFISENSTPTEYWERKSGSTVRQAAGAVEAPVQREATSSSLSTDLSGSSSGRVSVVNGSTKTANGSSVVSTVVGYKASEVSDTVMLDVGWQCCLVPTPSPTHSLSHILIYFLPCLPTDFGSNRIV